VSVSTQSLRRKIDSAGNLQAVVRTMKALAASSIGQYEQSVRALADYQDTIELGLGACLRTASLSPIHPSPKVSSKRVIGAVIFGSDQGLVGQFNDQVADYALEALAAVPGTPRVWAVGERVQVRLLDAGLAPVACLPVPTSVQAVTPLVGQILLETEAREAGVELAELHLFYNRPGSGAAYAPYGLRLLPLDEVWRQQRTETAWPTKLLPEIFGDGTATLGALIREYLFVCLFRACAESLASENASRLAAMQRAERNIDELLERLNNHFHQLRQSGIDEELSDVTAGFEALTAAQ
jgi:F-type H+-transporting ATPase subunit gamma